MQNRPVFFLDPDHQWTCLIHPAPAGQLDHFPAQGGERLRSKVRRTSLEGVRRTLKCRRIAGVHRIAKRGDARGRVPLEQVHKRRQHLARLWISKEAKFVDLFPVDPFRDPDHSLPPTRPADSPATGNFLPGGQLTGSHRALA